MDDSGDGENRGQPVFGLMSAGTLVLAGCAFGLIIFLRVSAAHMDFAIVNAVTAGLACFGWLLMSFAFWISAAPRRVWRVIFCLPIICIAGFLVFNRVKRINGELVPQFVSRWGTEEELPTVAPNEVVANENAETPEWLTSRETDFPQFMGPGRDGKVPGLRLSIDWDAVAPEIKWKQPIGEGWSGFAIQGDLAITMEQRDEEEWVTAYDINDGSLRWKYAMGGLHFNPMGGVGPRATPTINNFRVFAQSAVSEFVCLDLITGKQLWRKELLDGEQADFEKLVAWGRSASPLVIDNRVIVAAGGVAEDAPVLLGFDVETGEEVFRAGEGLQISYSSPLVGSFEGVPQIIYTSEKKVSGFDIDSGELLWQHDAPGESNAGANVSQPIVIDGTRLLVTKGYGLGAKVVQVMLDESGVWWTDELWSRASLLKTKFTSAVVEGEYAFGLSDGILECVSLMDGKRAWKKGRYRQGQVMLVEDVLLVTSESGRVVLVSASHEGFKELASMQVIGDVSWNTAALSGNRLLMRNADEMACVILPTEPPVPTVRPEDIQ